MAAPTITIADDDDHPVKPERSGLHDLGGVYHARSLPRPDGRHRSASRSLHDGARSEHAQDGEEVNEDWLKDDKKKQVYKGTTLLWYDNSSLWLENLHDCTPNCL